MPKTDGIRWKDGSIDGVTLRPLQCHADQRGWLAEMFRRDEMAAELMPAMGYVSATRPGISRGPHSHAEQTDCFACACAGDFELKFWDARPGSRTYGHRLSIAAGESNPMMIVIPPGVVHGYKNVSGKDGIILNFPNRLYAGDGRKGPVDEVRYEQQGAAASFSMEDE